MSKTSKLPRKKMAIAQAKRLADAVSSPKVVAVVDGFEAPTMLSREDRASRFIWEPVDVEHH